MPQEIFIAKTSDLKDGELKKFKYKGRDAVLVKTGDNFHAFIDYCTHAGGPLTMENCKLKCVTHYALFNPETGEAETLPAPEGSSLMEIKIKVKDGKIYHLNTIIFKKKQNK